MYHVSAQGVDDRMINVHSSSSSNIYLGLITIQFLFCQKDRWQIQCHTCTLGMWLRITLKTGVWLRGVHRTCSEMAAVSRGTSHSTTQPHENSVSAYRSLACNCSYSKRTVQQLPIQSQNRTRLQSCSESARKLENSAI